MCHSPNERYDASSPGKSNNSYNTTGLPTFFGLKIHPNKWRDERADETEGGDEQDTRGAAGGSVRWVAKVTELM